MQLSSWPPLIRARLKVERRILTSMLGLGITGLLGSAGTFALFTASSSNPNNVFTAGTLLLTDTTSFTPATTSLGGGSSAPNQTGTDPRVQAECSTATVAAECSTLIKSVKVAGAGIEPGQYLQGTVSITNAGTLPATVSMQVQNVQTNNGNNSLYGSGATGVSPCASDIAGVVAPGATGPQLTTGLTAPGYQGTPAPIAGCLDLGRALRITIQDTGAGGTGPQCLFGNDTGGALGASGTNGNNHLQAPVPGGLSTGGAGLSTFVATGAKVGSGSGACDDLSQAGASGRPNAPVLPGSNPKDVFGIQGSSTANSSFAALSGTSTLIFVPGGGTTTSLTSSPTFGGNLRSLPQWAAGETHNVTVTIALPDTGVSQITDHNHDKYSVSNDNPYQGGAASFDLYWFATQ